MRKKLIGNVEPRCVYCKFGVLTPDKTMVLCPKKGVLDPDYCCKKYSYDPLKRAPGKMPDLIEFSEKDFEL